MPLQRRPGGGIQGAGQSPGQRPEDLLAVLRSAGGEAERRAAALDLASVAQAEGVLAAALAEEAAPRVREAIFSALVSIASPAAAAGLVAFLRSEDVGLRNGATEALQQMGLVAAPAVQPLLASADPDERLFAVYALQSSRHPQVPAWLASVLERETAVNVGLAAVEALANYGGPEVEALLRDFAARFSDAEFVAFAVARACRRVIAGRPA